MKDNQTESSWLKLMATLNGFLMKNAGSVCETQECWDLGEIEN